MSMNKIFTVIFSGSSAPIDPSSRKVFIDESIELLDRLIKDLGSHSENIKKLIGSEYSVTHDFHRFAFKFDPEDERTSIGEFVSILSGVGHMGNTMCTMLQERQKEIDAQLRRVTELRARFDAFNKFSKGKNPNDAAVSSAFNTLKLDFTSEIIDQCKRLQISHFKFSQDAQQVLKPAIDTKVPAMQNRCCIMQDNCLKVRKSAPMIADAQLNRGCTTRVFETPLDQLPLVPGYGIPQVLFDTSDALLNTPGVLDQEGLFRLSASRNDLAKAKTAYDLGQNVNIWSYDANVIAGLMKQWFRELPDSVIPAKIAVKFAAAAQESPATIKSYLPELPEVNRRCLHKLIEVGYNVALHCASNKMTAENVSIVFGQLIIRREDELNPLTQVPNLNALACNMIKNYDAIFGPFSL